MNRKNITTFIAAVFLICIGSVAAYLMIPKAAKEDKLTFEANLHIGKKINLEEFENFQPQEYQTKSINSTRRIWLIYLLSGCEACKKEVESIENLNSKLNSQIEVIGVMSEDKNAIRRFSNENNIKFPILSDKGGKLINTMKLRYFPANFIVVNGVIEKAFFGLPANQEDLLKKILLVE